MLYTEAVLGQEPGETRHENIGSWMRCLSCGPCYAESFRMFILECKDVQSFYVVLLRVFKLEQQNIDSV